VPVTDEDFTQVWKGSTRHVVLLTDTASIHGYVGVLHKNCCPSSVSNYNFTAKVKLQDDLQFLNESQITFLQQVYYHTLYTRRRFSNPIELRFSIKFMMIWLSGDVALNPGPVKKPCSFCHRAVLSNHRAVLCEACYNWCHIKCTGISPNYYTELANSEDPWLCKDCVNFHFSDSFFDHEDQSNNSSRSSLDDSDIPSIFDEL